MTDKTYIWGRDFGWTFDTAAVRALRSCRIYVWVGGFECVDAVYDVSMEGIVKARSFRDRIHHKEAITHRLCSLVEPPKAGVLIELTDDDAAVLALELELLDIDL